MFSWFRRQSQQVEQPRPKAEDLYKRYKNDLVDFNRALVDIHGTDWNAFMNGAELGDWFSLHASGLLEAASAAIAGNMTPKELRTTWLRDLQGALLGRLRTREHEAEGHLQAAIDETVRLDPRTLYSTDDVQKLYKSAGLKQHSAAQSIDRQLERLSYEYPETAAALENAAEYPWFGRIQWLKLLVQGEVWEREGASLQKNPVAFTVVKELVHDLIAEYLNDCLSELGPDKEVMGLYLRDWQKRVPDRQKIYEAEVQDEVETRGRLQALEKMGALLEAVRSPASSKEILSINALQEEIQSYVAELVPRDREALRRAQTVRDLESLADTLEERLVTAKKRDLPRSEYVLSLELPSTEAGVHAYRELLTLLRRFCDMRDLRPTYAEIGDAFTPEWQRVSLTYLSEVSIPRAIQDAKGVLHKPLADRVASSLRRVERSYELAEKTLVKKLESAVIIDSAMEDVRKDLIMLEKAFDLPKNWAATLINMVQTAASERRLSRERVAA